MAFINVNVYISKNNGMITICGELRISEWVNKLGELVITKSQILAWCWVVRVGSEINWVRPLDSKKLYSCIPVSVQSDWLE